MGNSLTLTRAVYVNEYVSVLRKIGAPVDKRLDESSLPSNIEEMPQFFVSTPAAINWVAKTGHEINPMELGFLAAQQATVSSLVPVQQAVVMSASSGIKRLEALIGLLLYEDRSLTVKIEQNAYYCRVKITSTLQGHRYQCFEEWLNLQSVISAMQTVAGANWAPLEMCFMSHIGASTAVFEAFPNTRILTAQQHTSITIPNIDLIQTFGKTAATALQQKTSPIVKKLHHEVPRWNLPDYLRSLVKAYLADGNLKIDTFAEIAGMSTRSLQRNLKKNNSSFSQVVQEARFETACAHLENRSMKVVDVAIVLGYSNAQNFSRDFRRYSGISPRQYRNQKLYDIH